MFGQEGRIVNEIKPCIEKMVLDKIIKDNNYDLFSIGIISLFLIFLFISFSIGL